MNKEIFSVRTKATVLSVTNNKISAILKSDTKKTGLRLYDNGYIGIAGAIGAYNEDELVSKAKHMLNFRVPYDCAPAKDIKRAEDLSTGFELSDERFVDISRRLLEALSEKYPQFSFSHKIRYEETEMKLKNDCGAELFNKDLVTQVGLLVKHKHSKNLMDDFGVNVTRCYDFDDALDTVSQTFQYYEEKVDLEDGKMPVVLLTGHSEFLGKFFTDLNGRQFGAGASIFSGKVGQKLFGDNFSLCVDRDPVRSYRSFFDGEGTTLKDDRFMLIENGVLKAPFTAKKIAKQYGYEVTGSASAEYDAVPDISPEALAVTSCGKTIKELMGGRKGVLVVFASGGDFTSQGEYASPIQTAYLFDGERVYGRLPQLAMSANIYDMFGKDFIGASADGNSPASPFRYLAVDMNVKKIDGWM